MGASQKALAWLFKAGIKEAIDKWAADRPIRSGYAHASDVLKPGKSFCPRRYVLSILYPKEAVSSPSMGTKVNAYFLNGWSIHEKYQRLILDNFNAIEVETEHVSEQYMLKFTPDAIVNMLGEEIVVEIKGYNDDKCTTLNESGKTPRDAYMQANLYMHLLGIKTAIIMVENKNTQEILTWCFGYDEVAALPFIERAKEIVAGVESGIVPPRTCESVFDSCAVRCPMRTRCFAYAN